MTASADDVEDMPLILIVDDGEDNREILVARLQSQGYRTLTASDGVEGLEQTRAHHPDLILLDIMMPRMDGIEMCQQLKMDPQTAPIPVILVSARTDTTDVVRGLEAGADEYLTKPVDQTALVARVKSMLRNKVLYDLTVRQHEALAEFNRTLESRVAQQREELQRMNRLKQFMSPQVADAILSAHGEQILESHRQRIAVVFCDLRNYTAVASSAEPEEEMVILREYLSTLGRLVSEFGATLDHVAGDGIMAFFNDPLPCPDPCAQAVRMAIAMREAVSILLSKWERRGLELGFGVGIDVGYATIGQVEFEGFFQYTAVGQVCNLAARLCDRAENGQVLVSQRVFAEIDGLAQLQPLGKAELKGFHRPVALYHVAGLRDGASPPA